MITKEGFNNRNEHAWKMHVPEDRCVLDLNVWIFATPGGLMIDGNLISWGELEVAKREAQRVLLK